MKMLILILSFAISAFGQIDGNPENWCREGFFTRDTKAFKLGVVKSSKTARSYFYDDASLKCPTDPACKRKVFVMSGDQIVINRVRGNFACSWYSPAKGAPTVGWLKLSEIDLTGKRSKASEEAWTGEWKYGENLISISPHKLAGYLNVYGEAIWKGMGDNVHVGELNGRFEHKNGLIEYSDGDDKSDCKARLILLESFLIVSDNLNCGGANVTFSGIYRQTKK